MRYPAEETAEKHRRLLQVASTMFRARGIDAVSVGEVMKAAGMTHGAFYSHFASKDELASAAIQEAMDQADALLNDALAKPTSAKAEFLQNYLSAAHRDHSDMGCLMATLAIEIGRRSRDRSALSRYISRLIDRVIPGFRWSGRSAKRDQAILMIAAMTGAVILARAVDDGKLSDEILAATQRQLLSS